MVRNGLRRTLLPLFIVAGAWLPAAAAQSWPDGAEATGSVRGIIDGNELEWHTYRFDGPEGEQSTATYSVFTDSLYGYTIQGKQGSSWVEGAVSIAFSTFTGPVADCPCEFGGEVTYWTADSLFGDIMLDDAAKIIISEAEQLADGSFRLTGTAEAQLLFYESLMRPEPAGDPVVAMLEFTIDRVTLE